MVSMNGTEYERSHRLEVKEWNTSSEEKSTSTL